MWWLWSAFILLLLSITLFKSREIIAKVKVLLWAFPLPGPFAFPPFGSAHRFLCHREEFLSRMLKILEEFPQPIIKLWLGPKLLIIFREPRHLEKILQSTKLIEKDSMMDIAKPYLGEGLITGSGPIWKAHKRLITPTLNQRAVESYCEIFRRQGAIMTNKMAESYSKMATGSECEILLEEFLLPCAIDIVGETVLDSQLNSQTAVDKQFLEAFEMMYFLLVERLMNPWLQPDFAYWLFGRQALQDKSVKTMRTFIINSIRLKKEQMETSTAQNLIKTKFPQKKPNDSIQSKRIEKINDTDKVHGDMMNGDFNEDEKPKIRTTIEQLLKAVSEESVEISDKELIDETLTMFSASSDTVASIACFCLNMLAMHPEHQDLVMEELEAVMSSCEGLLDASACAKLVHLDKCIKETVRLFPIGPFIVRYNREDFKLSETEILPAGVTVFMSLFSTHRNPSLWKEPNSFRPEHFSPEEVKQRHPYSFLGFSSGLRSCVGKLYAMVSIKILVAEVLMKFRLTPKSGQPSVKNLPLATDISIRLIGGNKIIIKPRIK